jgi:hypothetical protein
MHRLNSSSAFYTSVRKHGFLSRKYHLEMHFIISVNKNMESPVSKISLFEK